MSASDQTMIFRPLIPVTLALLAGSGLGSLYAGRIWPVAGATLICAAMVLANVLAGRPGMVMPLLFCAGVGYLLPQPWLAARLSENHVSRFADGAPWTICGTIRERPQVQPHRLVFSLAAERLQRGDREIAVCGNIRVTVGGRLPDLQRGDTAAFAGTLKPIRNFNNPGGFDYARFMAFDDIRVRTYTAGERIRTSAAGRVEHGAPADRFRDRVLKKMEAALDRHPPDAAAVLGTLIVGARGALPDDLREAFNRSGLAHLLAISGLHVGMVAAAVFGCAAWSLACLPPLRRRGWVRKGAAGIAFAAVLGYALLAGLSPATQRALLMSSAFLTTYWISRRHDWANALAVAGLIILLAAPPVVLGPSFQLSFAAVASILGGLHLYRPAAAQAGESRPVRARKYFLTLLWVSLLATAGTLPLVLFYFNQAPLAGPAANLFAVPVVGGIVLPAGLLGVLLSPLSDTLGGLCWQAAALALEALLFVIRKIAAWPPAAVNTVTPTLFEIALWAGLMALVFNWRRRRLRSVGLALLLTAAVLDAGYWIQRRFDGLHLTVQTIDVGQGSANLLQLPGGYTVLVDGGGFADNAAFDVGKYIVAPYLWRRKIRRVDLVVLTHANSDHLNGLLYILEHFAVGEVWSNQESCATDACRRFQEAIRRKGIVHPNFSELPFESERNGVRFAVFNPPRDFAALREVEKWRDANNNSLVLRAAWGRTGFLFAGDIGRAAEAEIVARHAPERLQSTILIVPHHGSRSSCSALFLEAVRPSEAVIPVGWENRFGFPHPQVLERLERMQCGIWRTDDCGAVRIVTDGNGYEISGAIPRPVSR